MQQAYNDFGAWIRRRFPFRVQKISVDAGFSCPNRDGKISRGGCTFCDNHTFNPSYCNSCKSITEQLDEGKAFFARKYPDMKYLAYFQAYSNTYAPVPRLKQLYEEALSDEDVVGIVIGTRPDCLSPEILDYLEELNRRTFVIVGILVGVHIILGLPGEDREEILRQASVISDLPLDILKLHQLQIIKGTCMARQYTEAPFHLFSVEEYIELIGEYLPLLRNEFWSAFLASHLERCFWPRNGD